MKFYFLDDLPSLKFFSISGLDNDCQRSNNYLPDRAPSTSLDSCQQVFFEEIVQNNDVQSNEPFLSDNYFAGSGTNFRSHYEENATHFGMLICQYTVRINIINDHSKKHSFR